MQTILGSGGAIGTPLAKELTKYTDRIRLVSRSPKKVNEQDEIFNANLTDKQKVDEAVNGSDVVYLTAGLEYKIKIWQKDWPAIMQNTIDACIHHQARLVFFDNVYAYAPDEMPHMTENSRIAPQSEKGKVRAVLLEMIFDAIKTRGLKALVARSADFYGPDVKTGFLNLLVIDKYKKKQKAMWQSSAAFIHSFTYTPDAAKAVALLGNTDDVYNQTWHLPTSAQKWTGKDFIHFIAEKYGTKPNYSILSKTLISLLSLFSGMMKELKEMQYQNDRDYFFDSSKFEKRFAVMPTSYENGLEEVINNPG